MSGDDQADETRSRIITVTRGEGSVTLSLSCGHAALRRPAYVIPRDMMTDCETCGASGTRGLREPT